VNGRMILLPVIVQVILTMVVYVLLNFAKARAARRGEVDHARRGLYDDAWPQSVVKINNNIRNQFEVPVLFYVLSFALLALNAVTIPVIVIAWLFVLSRIVHAYLHIGRNHVPSRRRAFMFGCLMLVGQTVMAAVALTTG
jgi:hypothetical protein